MHPLNSNDRTSTTAISPVTASIEYDIHEAQFTWICFHVWDVIYQTRERVFHQDIQTPRSGWKNEAQPSFFDRLRGVWIPDETLFRVFDMASQTIHNSWRNSKQKFAKLYAN